MSNIHMLQRTIREQWFVFARFFVALMGMASLHGSAAELPRVALLSVESSGWSDLMTVQLSESKSLALVERARLNELLTEASLKSTLTDRDSRTRIGEWAKADFLVIVNVMTPHVQIIVCDTNWGVTLHELTINIAKKPQEKILATLCSAVTDTIESFANGIKQIVAVPDFVSRDLTYEHRELQHEYAADIRAAFRQLPGVAMITVDEAKDIAIERDLVAEKGKARPVSLFVEGEYRTTREPITNRVVVDITMTARNASTVLLEKKLPTTALSKAPVELMTFFRNDLIKLANPTGGEINEEAQYKLLIARADAFSALGEFARSAALREAALLLKPDSDDLRHTLIGEYIRNSDAPFETSAWPKDAVANGSNPLWLAAFEQRVSDWKRSLQHCEHLILNQRISREEATKLCSETLESISYVRAVDGPRLVYAETIRKDFIRHIFSRVAELPPAAPKIRNELTGALDFDHFIFHSALSRCDNQSYGTDDLELISELLHRLPEPLSPNYRLSDFLRVTAIELLLTETPRIRFTQQEYLAFLARLMASQRSLVKVYGRYGKLCFRVTQKEKSPALLQEAKDIVESATRVGFDMREHSTFMFQLNQEIYQLERQLTRENDNSTQTLPSQPQTSQPIPKPRISLEPIALTFTNTDFVGKPLTPDMDWPSRGSSGGVTHYRTMGHQLDVMWGWGAVLFLQKSGAVTEVLADAKLCVEDVVGDGQYVWVGGNRDWGISVLDRNGKEVTRIDQHDGLPPIEENLVLHPLEPGSVLAVSSFGRDRRVWIAILECKDGKSQVEVIHEATNRVDAKNGDDAQSDPSLCFIPGDIFEHVVPGPPQQRMIMIRRSNALMPLVFDPASKKISVYPASEKNSYCPGNKYAMSIDGIFWVPSQHGDVFSYKFQPHSGQFEMIRKATHDETGSMDGSLARDEDWLYCSGLMWRRLNLVTGAEELLVANNQVLPRKGWGDHWQLANSSLYGLVAFSGGNLFRVIVHP